MTSTSPPPPPTRDPQLAEQLDALLRHTYPAPTAHATAPAAATSAPAPSDPTTPPAAHNESTTQPIAPPTSSTTEPYTSRTAPLPSLPATGHLTPVLAAIAATGRLCGYQWPAVRELLVVRTRVMVDEYVRRTGVPAATPSDPSESFEPRLAHLALLLSLFAAPPFTLQRLCELLTRPHAHYHSTSHYLAALCKCAYGVTADGEDGDGDRDGDGDGEGGLAEEDEGMGVAEMEAAGVQVTSAMDYVNKELPIATVMPNVLSVEHVDDHHGNSSMETSE